MKLATFMASDGPRIGVALPETGRLLDIRAAAEAAGEMRADYLSMLALLDGGEAALDAVRRLSERAADPGLTHDLAAARLLAPLPEPRQMRDGMSFETHIRQSGSGKGRALAAARARGDAAEEAEIMARELPELPEIYRQLPIYYFTNRLAVCGPEDVVTWPRYSKVMDYELEFGIVTGKKGKNIKAENARDHIVGYTIFNDFSARDQQMQEMQGRLGPSKGKSFENSNALGPWIVTKDEIPDPYSLGMTARINGKTVVKNTSRDMLFSFEEILAHVSQDEWIHPGEFFGSGTVGNGCGLENGWFLSDGAVIELEVEKIGVLRNQIRTAKD
ncbi:fumarylacetoacetate hydrolase family protein [Falsigemmobacter faecalis]|uniref:Fumarylacetoacetate hydrolase family protein n=1 Tax=Falsigemmobacter faecalis TaxID=2488730 RepID=A0A3P3DES9_9RHOB|nr:fumarylacetoacetate hydrolase family protein [Falsigemmobacter faecalis]RRH72773.1 fumarylacetoacetate hydrolase family protein [Falsigemmobacter faecalis]